MDFLWKKTRLIYMPQIFRNIFSVFLTVLMVFFLTGCLKKQPVKDVKEITFWTLQLSGFSDYINEVIAEYEKLRPDIKIKWIDVPFSEGEKRALAAVLSRNPPDLINMNPDFSSTLASKGALINIKNLITKEQEENYIEIGWQSLSIKDFVFGIPWYITSAVTFYNTEILEKAGITKNEMPETYADLEKISDRIRKNAGKYVLMPTLIENGQMLKFFNKEDIAIVNDAHNLAVFNVPQAEEVLSFWKKFYTKEFIPAESITQGHRDALGKFQSGETAFIIAGANFSKIIKENSPQLYSKMGVSRQLTGLSGKADFSIMNLAIPKKSRYQQEALDFALFLTNAENQLKFCKLAPILPSEKHALTSDFFTQEITGDLMEKSRIISAKQLQNPLSPIPALNNRKDLYEIIDFMTQEAILGEKSSKASIDNAVKEWNKILSEN